ncbi:MAG TPA: glycosyltransferase family 4 protein [Rhizobacter sp.]|nr:glycosyltransferase family 4 protein [Rhizobacter sp.]
MSGLRVVHVVRQYLPSRGGMEDVVFNIARMQRDLHDQQPSIVTLDRVFRQSGVLPADEVLDGIPVHRLPYSGSERYPLFPAVLGHLGAADVVHVHGIDFAFDYLSLMRWWHRKPMVACTHGGFFHSSFAQRAKKLFFHSVTRYTARGYRRILASSANDGEMFRQVVPQERVRVIENGVDIDKFADAASPTLQPTILYMGRWGAHKGLPRAFDLLAALRAIDPAWRLIVAGREYDLDRNALALLALEKGVSAAVTLMPNPDNDAIRAAMGEASYSVCLSSHEGFGLAAIEAMSAGLVPVLSAIPPFERLAAETGLPLIVPQDAQEAAALVMQRHHELQQRRHVVVRAQAQVAVQAYSWSRVVRDYVEEYERAIHAERHEERAAA